MQFVIVTGMSGAGKSTALKLFEDMGFFCTDNIPPALLPAFAAFCLSTNDGFDRVAIGLDIRSRKWFDGLSAALAAMRDKLCETSVLFLDASDETLLKRYKETRRLHPLAQSDRIILGITEERHRLADIRACATYILDTSYMLVRQLNEALRDIWLANKPFNNLLITVMSFGFKYGLPMDSDIVYDVRFLPNPFYVPELKPLTGNDEPVQAFVMASDVSQRFLDMINDMVTFMLPQCVAEGRNQLVISIGCSGGKHRSVTLANALGAQLLAQGCSVFVNHRDVQLP